MFTCSWGQWTLFDTAYHHLNLFLVVPPQWETDFLCKLSLFNTVTFGPEGVVIWREDLAVTLGKETFSISLDSFSHHNAVDKLFQLRSVWVWLLLYNTGIFKRLQPRSSSSINYVPIPGLDLEIAFFIQINERLVSSTQMSTGLL